MKTREIYQILDPLLTPNPSWGQKYRKKEKKKANKSSEIMHHGFLPEYIHIIDTDEIPSKYTENALSTLPMPWPMPSKQGIRNSRILFLEKCNFP